MPPELRQARLVHVVEHASRTARDLAALFQAVELALAVGLGLAVHVVVIVGLAAGADEVGGAEERGGGGADFLDGGDGVREGGRVDEDLLVESVQCVRNESLALDWCISPRLPGRHVGGGWRGVVVAEGVESQGIEVAVASRRLQQ